MIGTSFCGWVCQNKRLLVIFVFVAVPILFSLFCFCWKVYLLYKDRIEAEEAADNARERLTQLETVTVDFKGQNMKEKLEDSMQFRQNPLRSDLVKNLDEVNALQKTVERLERDKAEIEDVKKVLLEKIKKHQKRVARIKDDIQNLGTNRYDQDIGNLYQPPR
jgi:hypothetical protein